MDLNKILEETLNERKCFHSEDDFKHALAWTIHKIHPKAIIRLEKKFNILGGIYIDIYFEINRKRMAIELKYKTKGDKILLPNGEYYDLKNQAAQNLARYDFCKDIKRLECLLKEKKIDLGWAVFLTNDRSYWSKGKINTMGRNFRIYDGRVLKGRLKWYKRPSPGGIKGREDSILLSKQYKMKWIRKQIPSKEPIQFSYLIIKIQQ